MTDIDAGRHLHPRRPHREAPGLRRHAARRARRVRAAEGPRRGARRAARGGGERRRPHRHQRLLRPARHQPDHPRGAASLSGRSRHRHQGRRPARRGRLVDPGLLARGADAGGARQPAQPRRSTCSTSSTCACMFDVHGPAEGSIEAPLTVLAELQRQGLVRHIGLSNVTAAQVAEGRRIADDRLRAEPVQPRASRRRRADRRAGRGRHRLRAVLPARRLHAAAVVGAVRCRRAARRDADAGGAGLAAAALAQHPADPRHLVGRASAREPRGGRAASCRTMRWRRWTAWRVSALPNALSSRHHPTAATTAAVP